MSIVGIAAGSPGLAAALGTGKSKNLATFSGANFNITGTLVFGAISDAFLPGTLSHVGSTDAVSTPGLSIGATRSFTTLKDVRCPR